MKPVQCLLKLLPLLAALLLAQGCQNGKTPQSWFDLTWAGLAGVDEFKISGAAEIIQPDSLQRTQTIKYTANLKNHTELSIAAGPAEGQQISGLSISSEGRPTANVKMQLQNGSRWTILEQNEPINAWASAAAGRLNPLAVIEELRYMKKSVREEKGAARGTRVLRIEPDAEQELVRLKNEMQLEMNRLDADWKQRAKGSPALADGTRLIEANRQELAAMLSEAKVGTVYHLTVSKKNNLPLRLMSETKISYQDAKGLWHKESLWNDAKFSEYR